MIAPEKLSKEKLSKILVRKHKLFLNQYKKEFELLDKIQIIGDKQEQLEHWLNISKNTKEEDKYIKELEKADKEAELLKKELEQIGIGTNGKKRYSSLKTQIKEEEKALSYWKERAKEFKNQIS